MLHAVIMAGGAGTRFWPASRAALPKQLLSLAGERSLLQATVARLGTLVGPEQTWVVTGASLVAAIGRQLPQLPAASILAEPCRRDTAPCIGLAALRLLRDDPDATMAVMPADHVIGPDNVFRQSLSAAESLVRESPARLVTFGIPPTYPAEVFGYVERGAPLPSAPGATSISNRCSAYQVARFREKPPRSVAEEYLASGGFYWNAGIFVWKAATIVAALRRHQPEMVERLETIVARTGAADYQATLEREFAAIRGISIDFAVMEHSQDVVVIEAPFQWDDVGTWQALARLHGADGQGNTVQGQHVGLDTQGCIIRAPERHLVVTLGVRDLIVVETGDVTLVADRRQEESIRKLVQAVEAKGWSEFL